LEKIYSTYSRKWIRTAPVIIVICDDEKKVLKQKNGIIYEPIDVAIAINHMTLAATELGLETYWIATFDKVKVAELLQAPKGIIPLFLFPIGYPA
jgi:nitroreductase